ncbi:MAG: serine/threonine-protein kinase, partial [Bryobacteraceae bacterium]
MSLAPGTRLGPYEILAPIGAGGMGEVYKARDTRLDRIVAIKTSKEQFDERFEREARAIATLNHPHICHLYDVGPDYLVMEYIEGTPLKGPMPLDQALKYGAQICDALDAAHRKGITHRDLKPANILVTKTAGVKLLDFGLAKIEKATGPSDATRTMALTGEGQLLGTLYYMSPEQLQGQEAGPTSDIFSFGLVLYELLTGKRAFDGNSQAGVIAGILERPAPSISNLAPPVLDRLLRRCLEKDPENRWQNAKDLKAELEWIATGGAEIRQPAKTRPSWIAWAIAAVAVVMPIALGLVHFRETPPAPPALRLSVPLPGFRSFPYLALSQDGRTLVISAVPVSGRGQLFLRSLDSAELRPLSNTVFGRTPFWSTDGRSIGFFADGKLKIVSASGGPAQTLCDSGEGSGGT